MGFLAKPEAIQLAFETAPLLAVGAELKSSFCLTQGKQAWMSPQFGDMENLETLQAFEKSLNEMSHLLKIQPEAVACDMHPNYLSTRWAQRYAKEQNIPLYTVQHHHAHIAAVMAENSIDETVLGISFDGTGYGTDAAIWGGEILKANYSGFERLAHLAYVPLAGGDISVKKPYRMALAHLWAAGIPWDEDLAPVLACPQIERGILLKQFERRLNTVSTSSMGRLFDAVASLIGIRQIISYEAQAAIEMEALLLANDCPYCFRYEKGLIDPSPVLKAIIEDLRAGISQALISGRFHQAVAGLILEMAKQFDFPVVALSGGVFQNRYLSRTVKQALEDCGYRVLVHQQVPTNDAGLALGQAVIAVHQMKNLSQN